MGAKSHKKSYSIACPSAFRDRVLALAERLEVNAGDLARSVTLAFPASVISNYLDPGEPDGDDRETVTLQSGPGKGKPWRRKPRIQVRLPKGSDPVQLRKALALALDLHEGRLRATVEKTSQPTRDAAEAQARAVADRLRNAVAALSGEALGRPVRTRDEALFVLGFPPGARPDADAVKARYRQLATVHHPDSDTGSTARMMELNQAMTFMRGYVNNR